MAARRRKKATRRRSPARRKSVRVVRKASAKKPTRPEILVDLSVKDGILFGIGFYLVGVFLAVLVLLIGVFFGTPWM